MWRLMAACALVLATMLVPGDTVRPPVLGTPDAACMSVEDRDGDGVADGQDILASARAYVDTRPRYSSAYVVGGRPEDGTGVCTDVVDRALLGAGYDLMTLVEADVLASPESYPAIEVPDPNIDFRRVGNLRAYFSRHASSRTLDPMDAADWQPGDIVCWEDHIGIVSDVRDPHGIPLVFHHAGPLQVSFEEDVLAFSSFGPVCGHWRMGVTGTQD